MHVLTTPELLKVIHQTGMNVSHDQLKYWRRHGLLPKPHIRGKGRGLGVQQLWNEVCVENVRLILDSNKDKRINLGSAGRYLFVRNKPIGEILLRRYLSEIIHEMRETERQRAKNASYNSELAELVQFLTPAKVSEAIKQTQTGSLMDLYNSIKTCETSLAARVACIYNCHPVFDVLVDTEFPDLSGITTLSTVALFRRQRSTLAWAVLIHHYGDSLSRMVSDAIQQIILKVMSNQTIQPMVFPKT